MAAGGAVEKAKTIVAAEHTAQLNAANENEFVEVVINGGDKSLREDVEPNANDFLKRNWESGEKGELYRIDDEWWFQDNWSRSNRNASSNLNPNEVRTSSSSPSFLSRVCMASKNFLTRTFMETKRRVRSKLL